MSEMSIDQVLSQMRVLARSARLEEAPRPGGADFQRLLAESLDQVNQLQRQSGDMKSAYALGEAGVDLPEVMVAVQKASVSFEAITQVRNKLLSAYQEVMNMQV